MIISRAEIESAISAYLAARQKKAESAQSVSFDTHPVLEVEAATFAAMVASVKAEPMYREALVRDLQQRIGQGEYYVRSDEIVEKLLGRLVPEALPA
jgi:anti-sigma28 factor (negative regulator of flagellin synthesis)